MSSHRLPETDQTRPTLRQRAAGLKAGIARRLCRDPVADPPPESFEAHFAAGESPRIDRDWQAFAALHPGFAPYPSVRPMMLLHLDLAIQKEATRLLELAEDEFERRRQAYLGYHDPSVWPRVAAGLRREMQMDALALAAAEPAADAGEGADPIFASIEAHAAARLALAAVVNAQDDEWVRQNGGDTSDEAMAPAHAAWKAASDAETDAWNALFEARPTTLTGVLALIRHFATWSPENAGQTATLALEDAIGAVGDGLAGVMAASLAPIPSPADALTAAILDHWPVMSRLDEDQETPEWAEACESSHARQKALLGAAEALTATRDNLAVKALALAWITHTDLWEAGRSRADYTTDSRLAVDIDAIAQGRAGIESSPSPDPFIATVVVARAANSAVGASRRRSSITSRTAGSRRRPP